MPLRLNLSLSKKMGLPNYGSAGASCAVELEVDSGLLQSDLEAFHEQVRGAYTACRQAVDEELARHRPQATANGNGSAGTAEPATSPVATASGNGTQANGHQPDGEAQELPAAASQKQLGYLRQLAGPIKGLGLRKLDGLAWRVYGKPVAALSAAEASSLIDTLKAVRGGQIDLATILEKEAP